MPTKITVTPAVKARLLQTLKNDLAERRRTLASSIHGSKYYSELMAKYKREVTRYSKQEKQLTQDISELEQALKELQ
jgi:hypothetical protein